MTVIQENYFSNLTIYELPYDLENGDFLASIINRNPAGVVSLY